MSDNLEDLMDIFGNETEPETATPEPKPVTTPTLAPAPAIAPEVEEFAKAITNHFKGKQQDDGSIDPEKLKDPQYVHQVKASIKQEVMQEIQASELAKNFKSAIAAKFPDLAGFTDEVLASAVHLVNSKGLTDEEATKQAVQQYRARIKTAIENQKMESNMAHAIPIKTGTNSDVKPGPIDWSKVSDDEFKAERARLAQSRT